MRTAIMEKNTAKRTSKKASIPVTVLVILTIALCIFALVSFSLANSKRSAEIKDFGIVEKAYFIQNNIASGYELSKSAKAEFDKVDLSPGRILIEKHKLKPGFINYIWTREKAVQYRVTYAP